MSEGPTGVRWRPELERCKKTRCPEGPRIFWWLISASNGACGLAAAPFARHAGIAGAGGVIVADACAFSARVRQSSAEAGGRVRVAAADHAGDRDRPEAHAGQKLAEAEIGEIWAFLPRRAAAGKNCAHQTQSGDHSCCSDAS